MRDLDKFCLFYEQTIEPELQRQDKHRRQLLRKIFWSLLVACGVFSVLTYVAILPLALYALLPMSFYMFWLARGLRKFALEFKPGVVRLILDYIDDGPLYGDLKYEAKKSIPKAQFLESKIFNIAPAVYEGEDFIQGRVGDIEFDLCELNVQEISPVRERLDTVFRGVFIRAKFKHPPKGTLLVLPKTALPQLHNSLKTYVGMGNQKLDGYIAFQDFTEVYTVYGSKNTKLSALLPEEFMKTILALRKEIGEIYLSCIGQTFYVAIQSEKDMLEPQYFRSNVSFDLVLEFAEDIEKIMKVIEAIDRSH